MSHAYLVERLTKLNYPKNPHPQVILLMAEILHQFRLVVYPMIHKVLYIPGGAGFQPSTVGYVGLDRGNPFFRTYLDP